MILLYCLLLITAVIQLPARLHEFELSDQERSALKKMATTLATGSIFSLVPKRSELQHLGALTSDANPFGIWTYFLNDPELFQAIKAIKKSTIKRKPFFKSFAKRFKNFDTDGQAIALLPEFCKKIDVPLDSLLPLAQQQQWEELLYQAIEHKEVLYSID